MGYCSWVRAECRIFVALCKIPLGMAELLVVGEYSSPRCSQAPALAPRQDMCVSVHDAFALMRGRVVTTTKGPDYVAR